MTVKKSKTKSKDHKKKSISTKDKSDNTKKALAIGAGTAAGVVLLGLLNSNKDKIKEAVSNYKTQETTNREVESVLIQKNKELQAQTNQENQELQNKITSIPVSLFDNVKSFIWSNNETHNTPSIPNTVNINKTGDSLQPIVNPTTVLPVASVPSQSPPPQQPVIIQIMPGAYPSSPSIPEPVVSQPENFQNPTPPDNGCIIQ
jgi:hypothetical protein